MRRLLLLLTFLSFTLLEVNAQNHKWELGPILGFSTYQGDIVPSNNGDFGTSGLAFGAFLRNNLHPNIALRGSLLRGKISGDDNDYTERGRQERGFNFSSPLTEVALRVEFDPFGHRRYKDSTSFRKIFSPYIFGGIGGAFFNPDTDYNIENVSNRSAIQRDQNSDTNKGYLVVPFGAGIKLDLSDRWTASLEYSIGPTFNDLIDGISQSGDPSNNDWYGVGGATLAYRFGTVDSDKDGIPDSKDRCPKVPGIKSMEGCPDSDLDGVADRFDDCPTEKGTIKGCPDRDEDGITDKDDDCPDQPGDKARNGCPEPDTDGDGIVDSEDDCPEEVGTVALNGCPNNDEDNDGIPNDEDNCPTEAGSAATGGCPDSDGDGIIDKDDDCPDSSGKAVNNGCPDSDGDGIADKDDKCPEVAGTSPDGCAEISKEDEEILDFAAKNVFFDTDRASFKSESYPKLDEIVDIMQRYQNYNVRIEGYTDNRGSDVVNQQLSERRARNCYNYLIEKGINPDRIRYVGYGENNPIASNNTVDGRRQNRRVEFDLVKQE